MDWKNLLWLGLGVGLGLVLRPQRARSAPDGTPLDQPATLQVASPDTGQGQFSDRRSTSRQLSPDDQPLNDLQLDGLKQQLDNLRLAYQMASESSQFKGGFLARVSHELRSPLNGLVGLHQLILSDLCDSPEEERDFVAQANTAAHRMIGILDDILAVARVQYGSVRPVLQTVELAQLFQELHTLTHLQAQDRNIRLKIIPPDPGVYVLTDPLRLSQGLVHLVDSAIRQLPEGTITVSAEVAVEQNRVYLWIDDQRPASDRAEPVVLLSSDPPIADGIPSPGLTLLLDQIMLEAMQAQLEVLPCFDATETGEALTRLRCSLPLSTADAAD